MVNDTDLRAIHIYTKNAPPSDRDCPRCEIKMHTIDLKIDEKFLVERCEKCLGIFFDPNELEALLDWSVSHVYDVDHQRMEVLLDDYGAFNKDTTVAYVVCPVCKKHMNRKSFGARSGVIVDTCKEHGVWLDGGELGRLLKWSKAGGKIHSERRAEQKRRQEEQAKRLRQGIPEGIETGRLEMSEEMFADFISSLMKSMKGK